MTYPTDSASLDDKDEFTPESLASEEADDGDLNGVKTESYYVNLQKLAEHGYIEWDAETQTIWRGPNFGEIAPLLRLVDDHRDELPKEWL